MATLLDTVTPPVTPIGTLGPENDPFYDSPWTVDNKLNGTEHATLGGRSQDVLYGYRDIGPIHIKTLKAADYNTVDSKLNSARLAGQTLYLQLPDSATIYAGYVPTWQGIPKTYGDGTIYWELTFTFKESIRP